MRILAQVFIDVVNDYFQFEERIRRIGFNIGVLAFVGPQKDLREAVAIEVCIVRREEASRLRVLEPDYLAALDEVDGTVTLEVSEWSEAELALVGAAVDFIARSELAWRASFIDLR